MSARVICPSGLSVAECIRRARDRVCPVYRVGHSWAFSAFDPVMRARRVSEFGNYWRARPARSAALLDAALLLAGIDWEDLAGWPPDDIERAGGWVPAFRSICARVPSRYLPEVVPCAGR